ncbi:uncharacterized protein LOC110028070 [Phalaenopsis equestris]|uniref:uncharacterized protein LOC110028070 n=1 Tax=Phalaenopsis equestris TaxID=78828 RepID=UPI0009E4E307|nr:uncharacterized protein LOC110028070 [Phalaenopsis equestris]XP_020585433.1 uncharacterized protein LOC110028070 [Phalaenopsis equestris]
MNEAASKIMTDEDDKVTMQTNMEASLGCFKKKASHLKSQESGNATENFHGIKEDTKACPDFVDSEKAVNREGSRPMPQCHNMPFFPQEFLMWPIIYPGIQMQQQRLPNVFDNHFLQMNREGFYPAEPKIHYRPYKMVPQGYPHELQFQEFQYFVVIDFEATCDKNNNLHPQEIIEFPSVLVNSFTGLQEAFFQTYVKPVHHQLLTDFCKELTGIQQIQVDAGVSLSEALLLHDKWLEDNGIKQKNFAVVTWSNWDCRVMLESECQFKGIRKPPYFNKWINLKVPFHEVFGSMHCNLKEAVELAGLAWEGRAHCGLDDARNTARLLSLLMRRGFRFSITSSMCQHFTELPEPRRTDPAATQLPKPKEKVAAGQGLQFQPSIEPPIMDPAIYCFCGVKSSKCVVRKPGPMQGRWFFGCGNWTASRRAGCAYFVWDETQKLLS